MQDGQPYLLSLVLKYGTDVVPNSQTFNCRLARAARVVCAQPGTVICSKTPLLLVVCRSRGPGVGVGWGVGKSWSGKGPDWKTPLYYFHMSLRWNFEAL